MRRIASISFIFVVSAASIGCMTWNAGWKSIGPKSESANVNELHALANRQIAKADSKERVLDVIGTYEKILKTDPNDYESLWSLGRYYLLYGIAYTDVKDEKKSYYLKSMQSCERAMYTNPEFKKQIDSGKTVWDAYSVLTKREIEAISYYYSAVGTLWKYSYIQFFNLHIPGKTKLLLNKMMELDPAWGGGHPRALWGAYYALAPKILGGDLQKSEKFFADAIVDGPKWIYTRFYRAKYLYIKKKDKEALRKDLEWVIAMDASKADSPYPWNVYFQREARRMLKDIDTLIK